MRFSLSVKEIIYERDGGRCFRCGEGLSWGEGNVHHRQAGGMGGSKNDKRKGLPSNGLTLCAGCHAYIESNAPDVWDNGWKVKQGTDPRTVLVLQWNGWRSLDPDGGIYSANPRDGNG